MDEKYLPLKEAIQDGDDEAALEVVDSLLEAGVSPLSVFTDCVEPTLNEMGEQFARLEIYLPDLVMAGDVVTAVQEKLMPIMQEQNISGVQKGKGVIATVQGDIHDIGKNMVALMLRINGFEMTDLGVDVSPVEIVKRAEEVGADLVCLSGLMLPSLPYMRETIDLVKSNPHLANTKVMVGGGPVTRRWAEENGADGYSDDSTEAVKLARDLLGIAG